MSLNKAIKYGKEHRKEYTGAKRVSPSCRNHKGCKWCEDNRTYHNRKQIQKTLVDVDEELVPLLNNWFPTEEGEEMVVPSEEHKRLMNKFDKCVLRGENNE